MHSLSLALRFGCCLLMVVSGVAAAQETQASTAGVALLNKHCSDCHTGENSEGNFDLEALATNLDEPSTFLRWVRIFDRIEEGEMPPKDAAVLPEKEQHSFLSDTQQWLAEHQRRQWAEMGRVQGRRLTNLQLERTLHDVLGIDIPLASQMPDEQRDHIFTNIATGQPMSHFQLETHLRIVDLALDEAFERAISGDDLFRKSLDAKGLSRPDPKRRNREPELIDDFGVIWSSRLIFYGRLPSTTARRDGWYRFTVRAKALKAPKDYGVWCTVRTGKCVSSAPLLNWVGAFEATDEVREWTFETWLPRGEMLEIRPGDDTLKMGRFEGGQVGVGEGGPQDLPGVAMQSIEIEQFHKGLDADGIRQVLIGDLQFRNRGRSWRDAELVSENPQADTERLLLNFAARAFRRPVDRTEIAAYIDLVHAALEEGTAPLAALRTGYRALLCAPRFLYFTETPGELDAYALASRLSYFLWNTMPDAELLKLAESGQLNDPQVIRTQVQRMLEDPRGKSFIPDFAAEWLDLKLIDETIPDRRLYPGFDVIVQQSMLAETETYLQEMLDQNLSVSRIAASEETFLNERLARFYGIKRVQGDALQKVSLTPEDRRGGLITHGSILKVTANGTTTSPVIRGVWMSERILGVEIPPPPTNVPAIEPDIRGATSIREMLEKHKSDASCASCHVKIDPPGYALENYDPAGRWRDHYPGPSGRKGLPIDSSSRLPSGEEFSHIFDFQQIYAQKKLELAQNVAEKLIAYGTGAPISFADREELEQLVKNTEKQDYGLRSLVKEVAASPLFRVK